MGHPDFLNSCLVPIKQPVQRDGQGALRSLCLPSLSNWFKSLDDSWPGENGSML